MVISWCCDGVAGCKDGVGDGLPGFGHARAFSNTIGHSGIHDGDGIFTLNVAHNRTSAGQGRDAAGRPSGRAWRRDGSHAGDSTGTTDADRHPELVQTAPEVRFPPPACNGFRVYSFAVRRLQWCVGGQRLESSQLRQCRCMPDFKSVSDGKVVVAEAVHNGQALYLLIIVKDRREQKILDDPSFGADSLDNDVV